MCELKLPPSGNACVDLDRCSSFPKNTENQKKPDFIIIYEDAALGVARWCIVEMKRTFDDYDVSGVLAQLQAGIDAIDTDARFAIEDSPQRLLPLVLRTRGAKVADANALINKDLWFRGRNVRPVVRPCGESLLQPQPPATTRAAQGQTRTRQRRRR